MSRIFSTTFYSPQAEKFQQLTFHIPKENRTGKIQDGQIDGEKQNMRALL